MNIRGLKKHAAPCTVMDDKASGCISITAPDGFVMGGGDIHWRDYYYDACARGERAEAISEAVEDWRSIEHCAEPECDTCRCSFEESAARSGMRVLVQP